MLGLQLEQRAPLARRKQRGWRSAYATVSTYVLSRFGAPDGLDLLVGLHLLGSLVMLRGLDVLGGLDVIGTCTHSVGLAQLAVSMYSMVSTYITSYLFLDGLADLLGLEQLEL